MKFIGGLSSSPIQLESHSQGNGTERTEEPYPSAHTVPHLTKIDMKIRGVGIVSTPVYIASIIKREQKKQIGQGVLEVHIK